MESRFLPDFQAFLTVVKVLGPAVSCLHDSSCPYPVDYYAFQNIDGCVDAMNFYITSHVLHSLRKIYIMHCIYIYKILTKL